jgi:sigma-B regulation protein RsbU (phosphoserine phosphatase)
MRHELRTPINHILGYCEMLLEEGQIPRGCAEDLRRIHTGGRELQTLISRYFDEEQFFQQRDLHQLYHELRTPVNHIIGYSDLLIEQAEDPAMQGATPDLQKIRDAASNWLALMEAYLVEPALSADPEEGETSVKSPQEIANNLGFSFTVPKPRSAQGEFQDQGAILVVDDDESSREMLARRLRRHGYTVSTLDNGVQALALARNQHFDLVMLDMIMPGLDGFQVLAKFKADARLGEIPVIMLSALDEENSIARCIEMGAEDYLSKPFNPVFLLARIGACLDKKRLRDRQRQTLEALQRSEKHLAGELAKAAAYVRSLLPEPVTGAVETEWSFRPSDALGGDAFGYHWIDPDHFALYLLDVCGHGVGAALLSVSAMNTLRAETLPGVDFRKPADVLAALNRAFPMEKQNFLYFTLWYGVYSPANRELTFSSGGHHAALLLDPTQTSTPPMRELATKGPAIGCFEDATFSTASQRVAGNARLLVFSDGIFEIFKPDDSVGTLKEFVRELAQPEVASLSPDARLKRAQEIRGSQELEDDFSLLEVRFP